MQQILSDHGIVLLRQDFREHDRILSLYTRTHGRLNVRVPGVSQGKSKLKAFSEPFTCAEYRLYYRRNGAVGTVTGGKLAHVFPSIHTDLNKMSMALHFCELVHRLTPLAQPSPEKFDLLLQALTELEQGPLHPAFQAAFTLRLMTLAGFGLDHPVLQIPDEFWQRMHQDTFASLVFSTPEELLALGKCNSVCRRFLNHYLTYPLHTMQPFGLTEPIFQQDMPVVQEDSLPDQELQPQPAH